MGRPPTVAIGRCSTAPAAGGFDQGAAAALWALLPAMIADAPDDTPDDREARWRQWIDAVHAGPFRRVPFRLVPQGI